MWEKDISSLCQYLIRGRDKARNLEITSSHSKFQAGKIHTILGKAKDELKVAAML
jgi:hypothetical protein